LKTCDVMMRQEKEYTGPTPAVAVQLNLGRPR
jgi:hypothetical protein